MRVDVRGFWSRYGLLVWMLFQGRLLRGWMVSLLERRAAMRSVDSVWWLDPVVPVHSAVIVLRVRRGGTDAVLALRYVGTYV